MYLENLEKLSIFHSCFFQMLVWKWKMCLTMLRKSKLLSKLKKDSPSWLINKDTSIKCIVEILLMKGFDGVVDSIELQTILEQIVQEGLGPWGTKLPSSTRNIFTPHLFIVTILDWFWNKINGNWNYNDFTNVVIKTEFLEELLETLCSSSCSILILDYLFCFVNCWKVFLMRSLFTKSLQILSLKKQFSCQANLATKFLWIDQVLSIGATWKERPGLIGGVEIQKDSIAVQEQWPLDLMSYPGRVLTIMKNYNTDKDLFFINANNVKYTTLSSRIILSIFLIIIVMHIFQVMLKLPMMMMMMLTLTVLIRLKIFTTNPNLHAIVAKSVQT